MKVHAQFSNNIGIETKHMEYINTNRYHGYKGGISFINNVYRFSLAQL